jgi:Sec-independent protein translocase protein TatA
VLPEFKDEADMSEDELNNEVFLEDDEEEENEDSVDKEDSEDLEDNGSNSNMDLIS